MYIYRERYRYMHINIDSCKYLLSFLRGISLLAQPSPSPVGDLKSFMGQSEKTADSSNHNNKERRGIYSSMIHSTRPTVTPVATIVINSFVLLYLKRGDGRTICAKTMITTDRDCGLAEWIKRRGIYSSNCCTLSVTHSSPRQMSHEQSVLTLYMYIRGVNVFKRTVSTHFHS